MALTQYKKLIRSLTRDDLEAHLFEIFKSSKVFKDIESSCWSEDQPRPRSLVQPMATLVKHSTIALNLQPMV